MRVALDTNVLVYAEGVNGAAKKKQALELMDAIAAKLCGCPRSGAWGIVSGTGAESRTTASQCT